MKNKIVWILSILCVAAMACSIFVLKKEDHNKPQIQFTEDITYSADMEEEDLLKGVTATDKEDGDISDRVVVDSIVKVSGRDYVKVYYAVVDSSGNGVRVGKEIPYGKGGAQSGTLEDTEEIEETETPAVSETPVSAEETPALEVPEETPTSESEANPVAAPILAMNTEQVTLAKGTAFVYQDYVESITDDKDSEADLFRELIIEGTYDINTPGTYPLVFYTRDSDNNTSNEVPFTLIIQ